MNSGDKFNSPYYPRRARWYGFIFSLGTTIRHRTALDRIRLPKGITFSGVLGSFFIPGLAVYLRGQRLWGKAALAACAALFLCFIVRLGHSSGNYAFGLMLSIHASGFVYYCSPVLLGRDFAARIAFTIAMLIGLGLFLYLPLRGTIQNHLLMPLRLGGQVIVVGKFDTAGAVKRGDAVAYTLTGYFFSNHGGQGVSGRGGMGLGAVLATAGDRVEFSPGHFSVNGVSQPSLPHMPAGGGLVVPENHWFVWPNLAISGNWNMSDEALAPVMLQLADVSETQFVGKPFNHWFWRKQILP